MIVSRRSLFVILTEKVSLLHQYEPAIPRLGIAAFKTGTEALHGIAWSTDSVVPPAILHDYDQQAFEPAIAANAATGVMASYNLVDGRPNTVSPDLAGVERSWTGTTLMNVTDAGVPDNLTGSEAYYGTQAEADAAAIKAGMDSFTTDDTNSSITTTAVQAALRQGLLSTADVDRAVGDILSVRFRLGEFDPTGADPYAGITSSVINSPAHQQLARQAADEQMVLLRDNGNVLPLNAAGTKKVAVVGPLADTLYTDWYSGATGHRPRCLPCRRRWWRPCGRPTRTPSSCWRTATRPPACPPTCPPSRTPRMPVSRPGPRWPTCCSATTTRAGG